MKLDAVVRNHNALLEMERCVDGGAKSYSSLAARTEAALCYRPESHEPSFELVAVNAPADRVAVASAASARSRSAGAALDAAGHYGLFLRISPSLVHTIRS
jgi:hypothetical protein